MSVDKGKNTDDDLKIKPVDDQDLPEEFKKFDKPFGLEQQTWNLLWSGIFTHTCLFYFALYLWPFGIVPRSILIPGILFGYLTSFGITVGSHRYWTHRTFKAKLPLQIFLMLLQTAAMQYPIFKWCRDHRVHHKYTDTDADPHNASRGFWFSHITWLFQPKHPEVEDKLKIVDISDLARDPVVRFQSKYYWELCAVVFFAPGMLFFRWWFPEMSWFHIFVTNQTRYAIGLHFTFLVNSVAHIWGNKPYDKEITSTENEIVSVLAAGEGWHNYHHTFPWDYKSAELGYRFNLSTFFIHFFALIGWAYDMKTVSPKLLTDRINRTGDGSHPHCLKNKNEVDGRNDLHPNTCWGWGDDMIEKGDIDITKTIFTRKRQYN